MSFLPNNQAPHSITALQCFVGNSVLRLDGPVLTQVFQADILRSLKPRNAVQGESGNLETSSVLVSHCELPGGHEVCSDLEGWQPNF